MWNLKVSCELGGCVFTKNPAPPATALKPEITNSKTTDSSWFLLEKEWDSALPYPRPLTYIKHPVSSFPFLFSDFRSWQVSKLSTEILILSLQSCLTAAGGKRAGFPGLYWTIAEWRPLLCWMGLKSLAACNYFCDVDFNQKVSCRIKEVLCKVVLKNKYSDLVKLTPTLTKNKLTLVTTATILKQKLLL